MSAPVRCSCGEVIGTGKFMFRKNRPPIPCPGSHAEPKREEKISLLSLGLVTEVTVKYPETKTVSSWSEYKGPKNPWLVRIAMILTWKRSVQIGGKWCFREKIFRLYGSGAEALRPSR